MDFCLHVVVFTLGLTSHSAMCFHTVEERKSYIWAKIVGGDDFIALYCTKRELEVSYADVIYGEGRRLVLIRGQ